MTPTLTLIVTLEEANVLAQALVLLASDPSRTAVRPLTSEEWPDVDDNDRPELAALGLTAFELSSRVHDAINGTATPSWVEGLCAAIGR
jgi:hypothetical protein